MTLPTQELGHSLGSCPHLQLLVNPADVGVNRFVADAELLSDFLVEKSLAQTIQHFTFARGEVFGLIGLIRRSSRFLERLDDLARNVRGHGRAAPMHFAD